MNDISGFGLQVNLVASNTFPAGITISQFADDSDPMDFPAIDIADKAMGLNGDLITWAKANAIGVVLHVIPGSDDDINLQILFDANRVAAGKTSAQDVIQMTAVYPDGSTKNMLQGRPMNYMPGKSVAGSGRLKTRPYMFAFQDQNGL